MNIRALTIAAGLAAAGGANAAIIGFEAVLQGSSASGDTYAVFAVFDEASVLLNIFDANWVADSNFFQYTAAPFNPPNDTTAPNSGFLTFAPPLAFDSYVTIGDTEGADGTDTAGDPSFVMGLNTITGGWFDTNPITLDGATDINNKVFIAQLTVTGVVRGVSGPMSGSADVTYKDALGNTVQTSLGSVSFIPTPGAMALFGLAGLTAGRRRRA
jgi:hypothetical protein